MNCLHHNSPVKPPSHQHQETVNALACDKKRSTISTIKIIDPFSNMGTWENPPPSPETPRTVSIHSGEKNLIRKTSTSTQTNGRQQEVTGCSPNHNEYCATPAGADRYHSGQLTIDSTVDHLLPQKDEAGINQRRPLLNESSREYQDVLGILHTLKEQQTEILTDLWNYKKNRDGTITGCACYTHPTPNFSGVKYSIKVRFRIQTHDLSDSDIINLDTQLHNVRGILDFKYDRLARYLKQNTSGAFTEPYKQSREYIPIFLNNCTLSIMPITFTTRVKHDIFHRIQDLAGRKVSAKVIRLNPDKTAGLAWLPLPDLEESAGVPIVFTKHKAPQSIKAVWGDACRNYHVSGKINFCRMRLYRSVAEQCPPMYTSQCPPAKGGFPVFMKPWSMEILPNDPEHQEHPG